MTELAAIAGRRVQGTFDVDAWGLDVDILQLVAPLASLWWRISVDGTEHVPTEGPAVLVAPRRLVAPASEPFVIGLAVLHATGRVVRTVGIPDVAPIAPVLRRLGGVVGHPAEAASLVRAGHVVLMRDEPSRDLDAPVVRVRTTGWELGRRWRVVIEGDR